MIISAVNAMTMTPSRAMMIFKREEKGGRRASQPEGPGRGGSTTDRRPTGSHHSPYALQLTRCCRGGAWASRAGVLTDLAVAAAGLHAGVWACRSCRAGRKRRRVPDWLLQTLSLDPTILPPELTESSVPTWLYWTITALHALPGMLVGLLAGWFVIGPINGILGWLLRRFNRGFDGLTRSTPGPSAWRCAEAPGFADLPRPGRFDVLGVSPWSPPASSRDGPGPADRQPAVARFGGLELTKDVMAKVDKITHDNDPGVAHTITNVGSGGGGVQAVQLGVDVIVLKPFEERRSQAAAPRPSSTSSRRRGTSRSRRPRSPCRGRADPGPQPDRGLQADRRRPRRAWPEDLAATDRNADGGAGAAPDLNNVVTTFRPHTPQLLLKVDRDKVESLGVPLSDVNQTHANVLWARAVATFSMSLAGPGRSPFRPPGIIGTTSTTSVCSRCATTRADGAPRRPGSSLRRCGPCRCGATTCTTPRSITGNLQGRQLRRGHQNIEQRRTRRRRAWARSGPS